MKKHLIQLTKGITVEDNALSQYMEIFKEDAILKGAIMPDIHHGYTVPIGSVFDANKLLTTAIGADIGCGVDVYKTELTLIDIEEYKEKIKNELVKIIPAESHKQPQLLPNHLETVIWDLEDNKNAYHKQFGTIGGGNHFVEIGVDEQKDVYITVHSGSRGIGGIIARHFSLLAKEVHGKTLHLNKKGNPSGAEVSGYWPIEMTHKDAHNYFAYHDLAIGWARASRLRMANETLKELYKAMGIEWAEKYRLIWDKRYSGQEHNFAISLITSPHDHIIRHRKGAAPLLVGQTTPIPANMKDGVYIVKAKNLSLSELEFKCLSSASHGAGRKYSRGEARKNHTLEEMQKDMKGIAGCVDEARLDETPGAYKPINDVLKAQEDTLEVIKVLKPIINIKG